MKTIAILFFAFFLLAIQTDAQIYYTRTAKVTFFSEAPMENIEAHNGTANMVIDFSKGSIESAVLIKGFKFEKALMQEHFNENYMESHKYPKSVFVGQITDYNGIDLEVNGNHEVNVKGEITIHGVTQPLTTPATIKVKDGSVQTHCKFTVEVADFDISIPGVVRDNIAKEIEVTIDANLNRLEQ
nr:YceI family protein [Saprospiraceae bacterium]